MFALDGVHVACCRFDIDSRFRRHFGDALEFGAIVRGETTHHEVLGHAVGNALAAISAETGRPVGFGLLTCETMDQARARTEKGAEAAEAARLHAEAEEAARLAAEAAALRSMRVAATWVAGRPVHTSGATAVGQTTTSAPYALRTLRLSSLTLSGQTKTHL